MVTWAINEFEIFDLNPGFLLDKENLKHRYKTLRIQLHPDSKNGDRIKFEKISEAYEVLTDDVKRANCLLEVLGVPQHIPSPSELEEYLEYLECQKEYLETIYKDTVREFEVKLSEKKLIECAKLATKMKHLSRILNCSS